MQKILYGKSMNEVKESMSEEEKELMEKILNKKTLNSRGDSYIMYNKMFYKKNPGVLEKLKKEAFEASEWNCFYLAWYYKAKNSTNLSVLDLYGTAWLSLENAWKNFLNKTQEEIDSNIQNKKVPYASFSTFCQSYIKDALAVEILKNKEIDDSLEDWSLSSIKKINNISRTIQSYICLNGKLPDDKTISTITGYSLPTVKNFKNLLDLETLNGEEKIAGIQIKREDEIANLYSIDDSNKREELIDAIKNILNPEEAIIIVEYFYNGKTKQELKKFIKSFDSKFNLALNKLKASAEFKNFLKECLA